MFEKVDPGKETYIKHTCGPLDGGDAKGAKPCWIGERISTRFTAAPGNPKTMAGDTVFWQVLRNTVSLSVLCILGGIVISLGLGLVMNAVQRGQTIYSVIFYLPHLVPTVVSAIVWMWIFNAQCGLLNGMLGLVSVNNIFVRH